MSRTTFTLEQMKDAFRNGMNRGIDVALILQTNGTHNSIGGYLDMREWFQNVYGIDIKYENLTLDEK